jgi:excisionase family DNA binding protein
MTEPFLTAAEVAELLKLNIETVYTLVSKNDLPATKIGGQWRFDESEIREWFKEHRNASALTGPGGAKEPPCDGGAQG